MMILVGPLLIILVTIVVSLRCFPSLPRRREVPTSPARTFAREFKDVAFEDVVFDDNIFGINATITTIHNMVTQLLLSNTTS